MWVLPNFQKEMVNTSKLCPKLPFCSQRCEIVPKWFQFRMSPLKRFGTAQPLCLMNNVYLSIEDEVVLLAAPLPPSTKLIMLVELNLGELDLTDRSSLDWVSGDSLSRNRLFSSARALRLDRAVNPVLRHKQANMHTLLLPILMLNIYVYCIPKCVQNTL